MPAVPVDGGRRESPECIGDFVVFQDRPGMHVPYPGNEPRTPALGRVGALSGEQQRPYSSWRTVPAGLLGSGAGLPR